MVTKVLVVEDEPTMKLLFTLKFKRRIQRGELQFLFVHNGLEALKHLETHQDVAVVLSDINMPQMDGLTLLTHLQNHHPYLRTIIMSAYTDMHYVRIAMERGAHGFLKKPIDFVELETTLNKTIQQVQHRISGFAKS